MTGDHIAIAVIVIVVILFIWAAIAAANATGEEAERKLGREMTGMEFAAAFVFLMLVPYSFPIALAYVWLVMPDKSGEKAQ